jgi:hypothetical protein
MLPEEAQDAIFGSANTFSDAGGPRSCDNPLRRRWGRQQLANLHYEVFVGPHFGTALLRIFGMLRPLAAYNWTAPGSIPRLPVPNQTGGCWEAKRCGSSFRKPTR